MKYVSFSWSTVVAASNRKRLRLALHSSKNHWLEKKKKNIFIPGIQFCPSEPNIFPQTGQKTISDQNNICYDSQSVSRAEA